MSIRASFGELNMQLRIFLFSKVFFLDSVIFFISIYFNFSTFIQDMLVLSTFSYIACRLV